MAKKKTEKPPEEILPEAVKPHPLAGNQFWKVRSSHGRNPIFATPDNLWDACTQYFEWVAANPLCEEKLFSFQGVVTRTTIDKMRAMTITGLCLFLDISDQTWANYRDNKDFFGVVTRAEKIIYEQKFTGAAADLLNPNIIARDLGLAERQVIKTPDSRIEVEFVRAKDENSPT